MRLLFAIAFLWAGAAWGHEAVASKKMPMGWQYGMECCSVRDCTDVPAGEIVSTPEGWRVNSTGEVIAYNDKRIKRSRDENFHRCAAAGDMTLKRSICIYVPDQGF